VDRPLTFCAVDDHDIVLLGVEAMASREPDLSYLGGAADARGALALVDARSPDIVLLDLRLGSGNSFELCSELARRAPGAAVVMFSAFGNQELLESAIEAGAVGYVLKDTSTAGLPEVLRTVRRDGAYFDPRVVNQTLIAKVRGDAHHVSLSGRELTIARYIADGRDNWEIAEELNLSVHMIKFHVSALLKRYGVKRRAELVRVLMERHLI
jgi:two-component system, NarL family, response regulator DevR